MAAKIGTIPLNLAPAEVLLKIGRDNGLHPNDVAFLASATALQPGAIVEIWRIDN